MKQKLPIIGAITLLLILIGLAVVSNVRNQNRKVQQIITVNSDQTDQNKFIDEEKINAIIHTKTQKNNISLKDININDLETDLQKNPHLAKVDVFHNPNGSINVYYQQKKPILRVKNGNLNYYITIDYEKIPLSNNYTADVMLVEGNIMPDEYQNLVKLVQYIQKDKDLKNNIIGIKKERKNSYVLSLNTNAFDISLGTLTDLEEKFTKLKAFYDQYLTKIGFDQYKRISISYKNQVIGIK